MTDPVTEACRRVRDQIVQRCGGFDGYFDQLESLDRKRLVAETAKRKAVKKSVRTPKQRPRRRSA